MESLPKIVPVERFTFCPGLCSASSVSNKLTVASSLLVFLSTTGKGLQVTYPTISLHAISRADFGPSIYCQLDESIDTEEEPTPDEEEAMEMRELRINTQSEDSRMFSMANHSVRAF
jgi:chloride channel, nucleotide-sensitive, 1A